MVKEFVEGRLYDLTCKLNKGYLEYNDIEKALAGFTGDKK